MEPSNVVLIVIIIVALAIIFSCLGSGQQGYIYVITQFGKYKRVLRPGLHLKLPFIEQVYRKISIQNRSVDLEFQAVSSDQSNVYFKIMRLSAVQNFQEETIQK